AAAHHRPCLAASAARARAREPALAPVRSPSQTWRTLLTNHAHHLWAADLFTVPTLTFKTLYVLVVIAHSQCKLVRVNVTANPTGRIVRSVCRHRKRSHAQ